MIKPRRVEPRGESASDRLERRCSRRARSAVGSSSSRRSAWRTSIETPLSAAFRSVASTAGGSKSNAEHRARSRACAAAIERTPEPQPTSSSAAALLPASSSRQSCVVGCAAGAERAARVDHDRDRVARRRLPRRPDPERADPDRLVELPPAVLPARLDLGRGGAAERLPDPLLAGRAVRRRARAPLRRSISSKPSGKSSSIARARLLGAARGRPRRATRRSAAQRNALFSFSKKPSSRR